MKTQFSLNDLEDWELEIIHKFPHIYLDLSPCVIAAYEGYKLPDNPCNLRCGFEFNKGWKNIAIEFSEVITEFINELHKNKQEDAWVKSFIYKEKFGKLTWQGDDNLISEFHKKSYWTIINNFEHKSTFFCERTGNLGKLRNINGWQKTLSDIEYNKEIKI